MDTKDYTTTSEKSKKNSHLTLDERGRIQQLKKEGRSLRAMGRELGRAPNTIKNELERGTAPRKSTRGKAPSYNPKRGQKAYQLNREKCRKSYKTPVNFIEWVLRLKKENNWSFDACVGYAKRENLFTKEEMVCTKSLYNALHDGRLGITLFDMPEVLSRKKSKKKGRKNVNIFGTSIEERPDYVDEKVEFGHWEGDTVVGKRKGSDEVVLTFAELKTGFYMARKIADKSAESVMRGMEELRAEYGEKFREIFKSITFDNGSEFSSVSQIQAWGTSVFFAHPYSSWERPHNERSNRLLRRYIKKGTAISLHSSEAVLRYTDEINALPRKWLDYGTPEEEFEGYLDEIYAS